ncbi:plantaricin C family lantibiotic [Clostridium boliviensis]|uniref:Plantaricin C family lantibiotic n=1 Tax=Clostridium boliviensis TaxID=318465 RepID=A0ABU4GL57_9CLOT|nr:plantaricin C family lantibiotic [Clostridium boliviensis]MDW2797737.1 plantaricin C family lantibiotic [Clostridium boliviensis]
MNNMRNAVKRINFINPVGNVMKEMEEAELNRVSAGAGVLRMSGGVVCTATAECYYGTYLKRCCPK